MAQQGDKRTIKRHMPNAARALSDRQNASQACASTQGRVTVIATRAKGRVKKGDVSVQCNTSDYVEVQQ